MKPLRTFLEMGDGRSHRLRVEVAKHLLEAGCADGLPVILAAEFDCLSDTPIHQAGFDVLTGPELESVVEAALLSGPAVTDRFVVDLTRRGMDRFPRWLPLVLTRSPHDEPTRTRALRRIACDSGEPQGRKEALASLRASGKGHPVTERLTRALWWGEDAALGLTGQRFAIELLTGEELGYTSLAERRVFVSPLPLLREELNGDEILRGLIVHELGHQMYHATTDALAVNRLAWDEGLGNLLNLVQDEHLERNLRAREPYYGMCLSRLVAYAFHHSRREVPISDLMHHRSGLSLEQLRQLTLTAARAHRHVRVDLGGVVQQLEAAGSSLARFVRALRMGLGNRWEDPKVTEALALFDRRFRRSGPAEHLAIARRLRDLFGTDIAVITLFRLDELLPATNEELRSAGVDPDAVAHQRARARPVSGMGRKSINRGAEEAFRELTEVVQLRREAAEHEVLAAQVRAPAFRLRHHLQAMGLGLQPQRRRVAGPRIDRSRLGMSLTTRDARILVRRQPRPTADLFLGLLVDCSGSMGDEGKIERARLIATMVAEACRHLPGVDLRIMGFTDKLLYDAGNAAACAAHALPAGGGNNDAGALWHMAQVALQSRRSARLLLMVSDGSPTECTVASLRALVDRLTLRHGLACAQIAVEPLSEICFEHHIEVTEPEAVPAAVRIGEVLAALTQQSMRRT